MFICVKFNSIFDSEMKVYYVKSVKQGFNIKNVS